MSYQAVTDYQIISARDIDALEQEVKSALDDGWQPLGGAVIVPRRSENGLTAAAVSQTMVLRSPRPVRNVTVQRGSPCREGVQAAEDVK